MILEKNGKNINKNLRRYFWKLSGELLNRIWSVCRYCNDSVYLLCKDSNFLKVDVKR